MLVVLVTCLTLGKTVPVTNVTEVTRACAPPLNTFPFCDTSLNIDDRVWDLISRLKDEEKPRLLTAREGGGGSPGPPGNVTRLGLPEYDWGLNCLHGAYASCVSTPSPTDPTKNVTYCPTLFPTPVNFGATWNDDFAEQMGRIIGLEVRALWRAGATEETAWSGRPHMGLDCWSPTININRDPRWGRNQEAPSEDPLVNGRFGARYTKALQEGQDPRYIQVVVTLKHFDAYSLENSSDITRHTFNAIVSNYSFQDTYWPAFKMAVKNGGAKGVMCSYNEVNGVPACASRFLNHVLRDSWGFNGYITSDTDAITDMYATHHYVKTAQEAACKALVDGNCDINSGEVYHNYLLDAVNQGLCTMDDVHGALFRSLKLRFQLGLFDPIENQPYWKVPLSVVNSPESQQISKLITLQSMILLKNDNILPLPKGKRIAVIGPHAYANGALLGNYIGQVCEDDTFNCVQTPFAAIKARNVGGYTNASRGCGVSGNDTSGFSAAIALASSVDYVVLMFGLDESIESESLDRTFIDLPSIQRKLAQALLKVNPNLVLVLLNGGMVAIDNEKTTIPAIIEAGYPGLQGADAIAMTLFGDNEYLGGKLPYTVYPGDYVNQIELTDMDLSGPVGRSYRYYTGPVLYPFGYGLSLTKFSLQVNSVPSVVKWLTSQRGFEDDVFSINVTNTGNRVGDEVVFFFLQPTSLPSQPKSKLIRKLVGYQRVHLQPNTSTVAQLEVSADLFYLVDVDSGDIVSTPGSFDLVATNGVDQNVIFSVTISGPQVVVEKFPEL